MPACFLLSLLSMVQKKQIAITTAVGILADTF